MKATAVCLLLWSTWAAGQEASIRRSNAAGNRIDSLTELSSSLEALSSRVSKAVVQIFSSGYALRTEGEDGTNTAAVVTRQRATGSGVLLSADGYILTMLDCPSLTRNRMFGGGAFHARRLPVLTAIPISRFSRSMARNCRSSIWATPTPCARGKW